MLHRLSDTARPALAALSLASAVLLASAAAAEGHDMQTEDSSSRPIELAVVDDGDYLDVSVVAGAPCACKGRFSLESSAGRSNRSVNSGTFGNGTSQGAVLTRVRVRRPADWNIKLVVEMDGQEAYTEQRSSSVPL